MMTPSILRKAELNRKLAALDPPEKDLPLFLKGAFSILQKEVAFQVGWFFHVDPSSLKRTDSSLQIWSGPSPQIESGPLFLDERLFPSVAHLVKMENVSMQGEEWWTRAQLMDHALYQKVLKPEGLFFPFISLLVDRDKATIGYLVLWKKERNGKFSVKECSLLSDLLTKIGLLFQNRSNDGVLDAASGSAPPLSEARLFNPIEKISRISEEELYSLIRRRAQPGVLILSQEGNILYLNHDAKLFLEGLMPKSLLLSSADPGDIDSGNNRGMGKPLKGAGSRDAKLLLPGIIYQLYVSFSDTIALRKKETLAPMSTVNRICIHEGKVYLLRALLVQEQGVAEPHSNCMILIEKVSQGIRVDQIDLTAKLTPREEQVAHFLFEGKTNKEIAACIGIGEYTVKDHVKRIMKKLDVTTRAGIVAKVLQRFFPS